MPNEKTHFIAGALAGATVNVLIQSTQMAMDYDRPFDWSEFFLCTGAGAFITGRDAFHPVPNSLHSAAASDRFPRPIRWGEGQGEGLFGHSEVEVRSFFHTLLSAALIAWAISGKHTLKLSRTTRLSLWAFGISHLSHIALDCATPKPINLI